MEKILILITLMLLTACMPNQAVVSNGEIQAYHFEHEGHQYIQFSVGVSMWTNDHYVGYVHDPDCSCNKTE